MLTSIEFPGDRVAFVFSFFPAFQHLCNIEYQQPAQPATCMSSSAFEYTTDSNNQVEHVIIQQSVVVCIASLTELRVYRSHRKFKWQF